MVAWAHFRLILFVSLAAWAHFRLIFIVSLAVLAHFKMKVAEYWLNTRHNMYKFLVHLLEVVGSCTPLNWLKYNKNDFVIIQHSVEVHKAVKSA